MLFLLLTDTTNKIIIPENIAIQLANSSEVSAEYFFQDLYRRYQQYHQQEQNEVQTIRQKGRSGKGAKYNRRMQKQTQKQRDKAHEPLPTIPSTETSTINRKTTNSPIMLQTKDQAYIDDEDLDNDYDQSEASGANRIRINDTSVVYNFDSTNDD